MDLGGAGEVAAGHHVGQLRGEVVVVLTDVLALLELVERDLELPAAGLAEHRDVRPHRRRQVALLAEADDFGLGDVEPPRVVHHDDRLGREDVHRLRHPRARRHLRHRDHLEVLAEERLDLARAVLVRGHLGRLRRHHHRAATGRDEADAEFDETDVRLGCGDGVRARHRHLAAAAEHALVRRHDDRLGRVPDFEDGVLEPFDEGADLVEFAHHHGHRNFAEVGADGEVAALVADHHPAQVAVVLDEVDGFGEALHDLLPQRVRLRAELEEGDAVAEIEECGLGVLPERVALVALDDGEAELVGRARVGDVLALAWNPDVARAVLLLVEPVRGHVGHPVGGLDVVLLQVVADAIDAEGVPDLERAHLPAEAPLDGAVHVGRAVGDLGDAAGAVAEEVERGLAEERADAVLVLVELRQPVFELAALERADVDGGLFGLLVLHRPHVDGLDDLALFLVEPGLRLRAEPSGLDKLVEHVGHAEGLAALVLGDRLVEVVGDVAERVEPDDVGRAERRALRVADELPREFVDLLDRVVALGGLAERLHHRVDADPVADEVRRVFGDDDALAEVDAGEVRHALDNCRVGVRRRDHLEQLEVARRVEEVGPEEALLEIVRAALGDLVDRQAGGVRRDHGRVARVLLDAGHHVLLDVHPLDDDLDHPVHVGDLVEVVLEIAEGDALLRRLGEERRGVHLRRVLESAFDDRVGLAFLADRLRRDIEEKDFEAGVGEVGRDLRAHNARAEHGGGTERPVAREALGLAVRAGLGQGFHR